MVGEILLLGLCYLSGRRAFWGCLLYLMGHYQVLYYPLILVYFAVWWIFYYAPFSAYNLVLGAFQDSLNEFYKEDRAEDFQIEPYFYRRARLN
ncbi:hypothetical protein [Tupavirus incomtus]|uniref:Uncharacterized protein n=1 Tax=Tupavirus sp. TaxID=2809944 RepID=A0AAE9ZZB7_9RHAB|nr:hypothetical protein [Tupavirus sp.]